MIYRNRIKEALESTGFALGIFAQIASPENAEIAAASGYDFIIIDTEHGSYGIETMVHMIRGVQVGGAAPVVRLPDDSSTGIMKALDAGAVGILIPGVSSKERVQKIIEAARYAPIGKRGACPRVRATCHGIHPWEDHVAWSNRNITIWLLIETVEGFDHLEEILSVPGIDAVSLGAFDLSQSMGLNGKTDHPEVRDRIAKGINLALKNKVDVHLHLFEASSASIGESARNWANLGVRILSAMTDRRILTMGNRDVVSGLSAVRAK